MTTFQVLKNFIVNTPKGEKILQAGNIIALPEDKAKELIQKGAIAQGIRWETLSHIHLQTCRSLAAEKVNLRLQSKEITGAEDVLNNTWRLCLRGELTLDDFRGVNQRWAAAIRTANRKNQRTTLFEGEI